MESVAECKVQLVVPIVFVLEVPVVFIMVVLCSSRLPIVVVCFTIIPCGCVVWVCCRCHCPFLSSIVVVVHRGCGWWCIVVCGAGPHIVVISRRPWLWPCSCFIRCLLHAHPLWLWSLCQSKGWRGEGCILTWLSFCNAKHMLTLSLQIRLVLDEVESNPVSTCLCAHCMLSRAIAVWSWVQWRWTTKCCCSSFGCQSLWATWHLCCLGRWEWRGAQSGYDSLPALVLVLVIAHIVQGSLWWVLVTVHGWWAWAMNTIHSQ